MTRNVNRHIAYCPIYRCGEPVEVPDFKNLEWTFCEHCNCPWWPLELGYTGNAREDVIEFARTHDFNGKPKPLK